MIIEQSNKRMCTMFVVNNRLFCCSDGIIDQVSTYVINIITPTEYLVLSYRRSKYTMLRFDNVEHEVEIMFDDISKFR